MVETGKKSFLDPTVHPILARPRIFTYLCVRYEHDYLYIYSCRKVEFIALRCNYNTYAGHIAGKPACCSITYHLRSDGTVEGNHRIGVVNRATD